MVQNQKLDKTLHALSHHVRRDMLTRLSEQDARVTDLAEHYKNYSLNAVSKHLKVLEEAELITRTKIGRVHQIKLNAEPMKEIEKLIQFFSAFWMNRIDKLEEMLNEEENDS
ncbi:MAG: metalloregulator ArsR/SmtB family transcription factor [Opitutales bacterium]|nr:metalloregulator ArsR/SmtB family transcription factor [Opitutales bacterium]